MAQKNLLVDHHIKIMHSHSQNFLEGYLANRDYFVCIDKKVYQKHYFKIKKLLQNAKGILLIEATEENKNLEEVNKIYQLLVDKQADRNSFLLAIGGGLVGDLVGYVAATYMRGLKLINLPTTLLSCCDSCVGAKVGVNYQGTKNLLGTFYQAELVLIDLSFLTTLTTRLFKEGLVEIIKHGLLVDQRIITDLQSYDNIYQLRKDKAMIKNLIKKSLQVKLTIIEQDYYDHNLRQQLNFGHSIAHCFELADNNDYYHGEAVAIGILLALTLNNDFKHNEAFLTTKILFEKFGCLKELVALDFNNLYWDKKKNKNYINEVTLTKINTSKIECYLLEDLITTYQTNYQLLQDIIVPSQSLLTFYPHKLQGHLFLPPAKSYLHRYLIAAALSKSVTYFYNVTSLADDILVTIDVLKKLDCSFSYQDSLLIVDSRSLSFKDELTLEMNESASSLRMMLPLLLCFSHTLTITGKNRLNYRSLEAFYKLFDDNEISYSHPQDSNFPLEISGKFKNDELLISGNHSSQFISGLLFILPFLSKNTTIKVTGEIVSLPYLKMTIKTLADFNVIIKHSADYRHFQLSQGNNYLSWGSYKIESDCSAQNYFELANHFGNNIHFEQTNYDTLQPDNHFKQILKDNNLEVNITDKPDCAPLLALNYSFVGGTITGINRLLDKESNRLAAICDFLTKMAVNYQIIDDSLVIEASNPQPNNFNTFCDHRIAMSLIILSSIVDFPIVINESKSICKSFPTFLEEFEKLGGKYDEE